MFKASSSLGKVVSHLSLILFAESNSGKQVFVVALMNAFMGLNDLHNLTVYQCTACFNCAVHGDLIFKAGVTESSVKTAVVELTSHFYRQTRRSLSRRICREITSPKAVGDGLIFHAAPCTH